MKNQRMLSKLSSGNIASSDGKCIKIVSRVVYKASGCASGGFNHVKHIKVPHFMWELIIITLRSIKLIARVKYFTLPLAELERIL